MAEERFEITASDKQIDAVVERVIRRFDELGNNAEMAGRRVGSGMSKVGESASAVESAVKKVGASVAAYFAVDQVKAFADEIINVRKEMQGFQISLSTLLGSNTAGSAMFEELKEFAVTTPLMLRDLANGAQTMLGFNIETEKVVPTLKAIGDISMGDAQRFQSLTLAFSQMSATGKLMGQDLLQMINAGFNPLMEISRKTGKSISELKEEMSAGSISAEMVADAFKSATSEGGKFYGMLSKQGQGLAGQFNTLKGAIDDMMNNLGEKGEGAIITITASLTAMAQDYERVGRMLASLISTYGLYRVAVMAVAAAEYKHTLALRAAVIAQRLLNTTMLANPYMAAATALGVLVTVLMSQKTQTERVAEAEREYNKQREEANRLEQERIDRANKLIDIAADEQLSTDNRRLALVRLEQQYPKIFGKYDTEIEKLEHILEIKNAIAGVEGEKANKREDTELDSINKRIKELEMRGKARFSQGTQIGGRSQKEEDELLMLRGKQRSIVSKRERAQGENYLRDLTGISNEDLQAQIRTRKNLIAQIEMEEQKGKKVNGTVVSGGVKGTFSKDELQGQLQIFEDEQKRRNAPTYTASQRKAQLKKELDEARKALKDFDNSTKKMSAEEADKARKALKEKVDSAEKKYKDIGDSTSAQQKNAAKSAKEAAEAQQKITDAEEKARKERDRTAKDMALAMEQANIDVLKEGAEKTIRQINLNYEKEKEAIKREQEDLLASREAAARSIYEAKNKDGLWQGSAEKQTFQAGNVLTEEDKAYFSAKEKAAKESHQRQIKAQNDLDMSAMNEYLIKYGTFQQRITAIKAKYDKLRAKATTKGEELSLMKQEEEEIRALNEAFGISVKSFADLFADASEKSTKEIQKIIDKYRMLVEFLQGGGLTGGDVGVDENGKKRKETNVSMDDLKDVGFSEADIQNLKPEDIDRITQALKNLHGTLSNKSPWMAFMEASKKALEDIRNGEVAKGVAGLAGAVRSFLPAVQEFASSVDNLFGGSKGDDIGNIVQGMDGLMQTGQGVAQFMSGDMVGGIMSTVNGLSTLKNAFVSLADKGNEKRIQKLQKYIDSLQESYIDLERAVDKTYSKEKKTNIEAELKNKQEQIGAIQKQIQEERDKKKTDNKRIAEWEKQISSLKREIDDLKEQAQDAIFGADIKSHIEAFADAYTSAWEQNVSVTRSVKDQVRKMMRQMVNESIKSAMQASDAMKKIREKLTEFWADNYLSAEEQKYIEWMADDLGKKLDKQYGWANSLFKDSYSQEATKGGFQTMSQDSADELNGRFAALQQNATTMVNLMTNVHNRVLELRSMTESIRSSTEQSVNIGLESVNHLAKIEKNTNQLYEMNERLDKIERNTRGL